MTVLVDNIRLLQRSDHVSMRAMNVAHGHHPTNAIEMPVLS
jgi:hypothetical protein